MNQDEKKSLCPNLPTLLESKDFSSLSILLQNLPGAVYCCSPDPSATLQFVSKQIEEIVGYSDSDLVSGPVSWIGLIHPDDREWTKREVLKAASERGKWSLEYRIRDASGHEHWILDRGSGVYHDAELLYLQGFVSDISEARLSREEIRESEQRFRGTFENAAVGIAHVGLDGKWFCVNDRLCQILGYSHDELSEKTFGDITHPDDLNADWGQAKLLLAGKISSYSMEKRYFRKDASVVWANLTGSLVRDDKGEPEYFIAVVEDIDARKKAEQALRKMRAVQLRTITSELIGAEESERRRIAQFVHDHLQQILVAARLSLVPLIGKAKDPDSLDQLTRVKDLIEESIHASRSLTSELTPQILYQRGLFEAFKWLGRWMGEKHGVSVKVNVCDGERSADLDPQTTILLFQSVRELLFNIVKHACVLEATVNGRLTEDKIVIVVEDRGKGFEPQAGQNRPTDEGFGHFSIHERLSLIGGTFEIQSTPGKGTRVTLEAPTHGGREDERILNDRS